MHNPHEGQTKQHVRRDNQMSSKQCRMVIHGTSVDGRYEITYEVVCAQAQDEMSIHTYNLQHRQQYQGSLPRKGKYLINFT